MQKEERAQKRDTTTENSLRPKVRLKSWLPGRHGYIKTSLVPHVITDRGRRFSVGTFFYTFSTPEGATQTAPGQRRDASRDVSTVNQALRINPVDVRPTSRLSQERAPSEPPSKRRPSKRHLKSDFAQPASEENENFSNQHPTIRYHKEISCCTKQTHVQRSDPIAELMVQTEVGSPPPPRAVPCPKSATAFSQSVERNCSRRLTSEHNVEHYALSPPPTTTGTFFSCSSPISKEGNDSSAGDYQAPLPPPLQKGKVHPKTHHELRHQALRDASVRLPSTLRRDTTQRPLTQRPLRRQVTRPVRESRTQQPSTPSLIPHAINSSPPPEFLPIFQVPHIHKTRRRSDSRSAQILSSLACQKNCLETENADARRLRR